MPAETPHAAAAAAAAAAAGCFLSRILSDEDVSFVVIKREGASNPPKPQAAWGRQRAQEEAEPESRVYA
ncbi:hypothetical protein Emed_001830 [Eimeria media]